MKLKITKKILLGIAGFALLAAGYGWYQAKLKQDAAEQAPVAKEKPRTDTIRFSAHAPQLAFLQVDTVKLFPEPAIDSLNARLDYDDNMTARLFTPVAGRVVEILIDAGETVKKGDPLLRINSPEFAQAAADRSKANSDLLHKQQIFERAKQLFEAKAIAQRDLEVAEADFHQAEAESQRAVARYNNLSGGSTEKDYILRAPIDGVVSERQVTNGTEVRPDASNPLLVITNPRHLWIYIDLPEIYITQIKVGQKISVQVDAYTDPGDEFEGVISVVGNVLDPVTRRIQVRADIDNNQEHKLKAEMFARVHILKDDDAEEVSVPRIPNTAIFTLGNASYVFVEMSPGEFQRRKVELGVKGREYSYVKRNLKKGERLVVTGALLLNSELSGDI